jgi:hypothetical protein
MLAGCGSTATVLIQRSGDPSSGSLGAALSQAYPKSWIGLNITLSVAQMVGYAIVAVLLLISPGQYFRRSASTTPPAPAAYPYGHQQYPWPAAAPQQAPQSGPDDEFWSRPAG